MIETRQLHGETRERVLRLIAGPMAHGFLAGVKASAAKIAPATAHAEFALVQAGNGAVFVIPLMNLPRFQARYSDTSNETAGITAVEVGILASLVGLEMCAKELSYRSETKAAESANRHHTLLLEYLHTDGGYLDTLTGDNRTEFLLHLNRYGDHMN